MSKICIVFDRLRTEEKMLKKEAYCKMLGQNYTMQKR